MGVEAGSESHAQARWNYASEEAQVKVDRRSWSKSKCGFEIFFFETLLCRRQRREKRGKRKARIYDKMRFGQERKVVNSSNCSGLFCEVEMAVMTSGRDEVLMCQNWWKEA